MPKRKLSTPSEDDDASAFAPSAAEEDPEELVPIKKSSAKKTARKTKSTDGTENEEPRAERPPDINSDYLPLPWKGRIGYACLNTYLRTASPPIFCSRTCRIDTILKHGAYRLADGSPGPGLQYVQSLGLQNARDLIKLIRWNDRYNIKFLRISSEMFPFASHPVYGYNLDFAKPVLEQAGKLAMELGHRLTTHPGQFTQIASPRKEVIEASLKDLEYHCQLLSGLGLKGQADRDAVMILHMGGVFGDKEATLKRFKDNYTKRLTDEMRKRLVLENDDVSWTVHDILPVCEELNIPLVLDYHHHNILHSPSLRAGTLDIIPLFPRITATWTRKNITQKQHYSEPCAGAVTDREMRKHSPRVKVLPPCDPGMDLMIEAKDKEQAVFELYRKYGIYNDFAEVIPHERVDENREVKVRGKKAKEEAEKAAAEKIPVEDMEIGMGGKERRVYWPQGKEEWLSPAKRVTKKKAAAVITAEEVEDAIEKEAAEVDDDITPVKGKRTRNAKKAKVEDTVMEEEQEKVMAVEAKPKRARAAKKTNVEEDAQELEPASKTKAKKPKAAANGKSASTATVATAVNGNKRPKQQEALKPIMVKGEATMRKSTRARKPVKPPIVDDSGSDVSSPPLSEDEMDDVPIERVNGRGRRVVTVAG